MAKGFRRMLVMIESLCAVLLGLMVLVVLCGAGIPRAGAAELAPQAWWSLNQSAMPSYLEAISTIPTPIVASPNHRRGMRRSPARATLRHPK